VGVLVLNPISPIPCTFECVISQVQRHSSGSFVFHILHCLYNSYHCGIAFRCASHVQSCLGQNNLCFRHANHMNCIGCSRCYDNSIGISIPHIFGGTNHYPSCNELGVFTCIKHFGKIMKYGVRVRTSHAFYKCRYGVVMVLALLFIIHSSLLYAVLRCLQVYMNLAVTAPFSGKGRQFHCIQCCPGITVGYIDYMSHGFLCYHNII